MNKLSLDKRTAAISALVEGCSIRGASAIKCCYAVFECQCQLACLCRRTPVIVMRMSACTRRCP